MIRSIIHCEIITKPLQNVSCATVSKIEGKDLNYPSFLVTLTAAAPVVEVRRTVTNVGEAVSAYTAEVMAPPSVAVEVVPPRLEFGSVNQKMDFRVRFSRVDAASNGGTAEGSLRWSTLFAAQSSFSMERRIWSSIVIRSVIHCVITITIS